ncbi:hypothetical protein G6O69_34050 [Pseudenhygromyxa sp. WMMC2535]|uniref:poly-gamma-glutamate biosynthesis protein PgsC/CapC n=1 Tax=Pseudenhygromyxa sp. WMMC2535 TaxID=2712867 RepID=UPI0015563178|nr:poly-gamma-glutamate biosynthesis protein PgsC/CapC [Pseudenhygromyxa sp. WMMC2535]NVB42894.1 hypothetical protein [Pseudenhygromyxa sp. WMMC2535]
MIQAIVLELLPARGLDQSMLLPVLVGLLVVLFFTEVFGWVFAGAVVPGYLASVLVIQPVTGVIVIFESLTTLAISAGLAKLLSKTDVWTRFFGRERFFLILLVSLIVRIHDHAWFAPWAINWLDHQLELQLEITQEFYSVGLVLVPLTANMLWKPEPHRGLLQLGVEVGITFLVVAFVLLPYTNLSLSSVELTYENTAVNFVAHAKAHIILMSAALLAAQFNLTYGWDFNGILVPALLALLWLTPLKLVATLVEAIVVLYLTRGFLKLPVIQHLDFEGPRKIVLVFSLAFLWKLALGFALIPLFPELKISDTYGFGYLLSSLLSVKMLSKKSVRAVMLPSLVASAGGFVIGSSIGFVLELLSPGVPEARALAVNDSLRLGKTPVGVMALARMQAGSYGDELEPPPQSELVNLQRFWKKAATWVEGEGEMPGEEDAHLQALGLRIYELPDIPVGRMPQPGSLDARTQRDWYGFVEQGEGPYRGWPVALLAPGAKGPVIVVPAPYSEAPVAEAAAVVCRELDCRAVLVAGREQAAEGTSINPRPLEKAMEAFAEVPMVVLRGEPSLLPESVEALIPFVDGVTDDEDQAIPEAAYARVHPLRGSFDLHAPWSHYSLEWEPLDTGVRPPGGDALFVLMRVEIPALEARVISGLDEFVYGGTAPRGPEPVAPTIRGVGLLAELSRMHDQREPPGLAGAKYREPSPAELRVLEELVVEPLVRWSKDVEADDVRTSRSPPPGVAAWASLLEYELADFGACDEDAAGEAEPGAEPEAEPGAETSAELPEPCMLILREQDREDTAGWGTLLVRRGEHAPTIIEVPRPHREFNTWRVGAELWQLSDSQALLIAGADGLPDGLGSGRERGMSSSDAEEGDDAEAPTDDGESTEDEPARLDRRLDLGPSPVRPGNLETPFQAMHQGIERALAARPGAPLIQVRGVASYRALRREVIIGMGQPSLEELEGDACLGLLVPPLRALVESWGGCQVADGSQELYLLSGAGVPQLEYSRELGDERELRVLWLSANIRSRFATDSGRGELRGLLQAGIPVSAGGEIARLLAPLWSPTPQGEVQADERASEGADAEAVAGAVRIAEQAEFQRAVALAIGYAETTNYHQLRALRELDAASSRLRVQAGVGSDWGRPFLVIELVGDQLGRRALVSLEHRLSGSVEFSWAELASEDDGGAGTLRAAAMGRPQTMIVKDLVLSRSPEVFE